MPDEETPAKRSGGRTKNQTLTGVVTPMFKLTFLTVLGLTILSLFVSSGLAIFADPKNELAKNLAENCSSNWKLGFGVIIGLISGKAI